MEEEYRLKFFEENGFVRKRCPKCGKYYWTRNPEQKDCGDVPCTQYSFIGDPIFLEHELDEMRETFLRFFEERNHTRISRYPVVARWRDDIYLTIASIADFQPFVTSGEVPPPANPLVISQPCIRLDDLDSVGRTGRHLTLFEMMAHHAFNSPEKEIYWKEETVAYCDEFLQSLGADPIEISYKEEPWAGGGNAGPCLEALCGGLEVATLVFMNLKRDDSGDVVIKGEKYSRMENYIVDTGYGLERFVWASKGTPTVYDAIFPEIVKELSSLAGVDYEIENPEYAEILASNARLAGVLDVSGRERLRELRKRVADELRISVEELEKIVEPVERIYAIADHTRCLTFMLGDGMIPSNAKEGYLARLVLRRTMRMMRELGLEIPLSDIIVMHIKALDYYPEFRRRIDTIVEIVDEEVKRYRETIERGMRYVERLVTQKKRIELEDVIQLYDTRGIPPEIVEEIATKYGVSAEIPDNIYSLVASRHVSERKEKPTEDPMKEKVGGIPKTKPLYYEDPLKTEFEAVVLDVIDSYVILDQTLFYPEGGGQPGDIGKLMGSSWSVEVEDTRNCDGVILHKVSSPEVVRKGEIVKGFIDKERRFSLMRHHSATHIVLRAAKEVLGDHVWQSGAQKGEDRSRLDITHFRRISDEERKRIELIANRMVMEDIKTSVFWMERTEAERKFGFTLYQGGVPPGREIRIVKIGDEVQACGGTHVPSTGMIGLIKILGTERIQDGVERIEFAAGEAAIEHVQKREDLLMKASNVLRVPPEILPETAERFFEEWKELNKEVSRLRSELAAERVEKMLMRIEELEGVRVLLECLEESDMEELVALASELVKREELMVILCSKKGNGNVVLALSKKLAERGLKASEILKKLSSQFGGGGGGTEILARGGFRNPKAVDELMRRGKEVLQEILRAR
jgi:alanyl-tRNA synthetase